MAEFTAAEVVAAVRGRMVQTPAGREPVFRGVSTDTRAIQPGHLFVALVGERFDGHAFVAAAIDGGAAGIVVSRSDGQAPDGIAVIVVDDTLRAFQDLARFHRQRFAIPVVAITGSNGKTSTKDMCAAVLSARYRVLKTAANYNNEIGLPMTLLKLNQEHQAAVVEMGMRAKGEIRTLAAIALPTMSLVTNVGETHMELLGSLDNIAGAKAELVEGMDSAATVVLNADDAYVYAMRRQTKAAVVTFGLAVADVAARNIVATADGTQFDCQWPDGAPFSVFVPAFGRHNVYNALAAVTVGLRLGLTPAEIKAGLAGFTAGAMRLQIRQAGEYRLINDAYNASPLSMAAAIDTLREVSGGRMVAVLGDMLELGPVAVEAHRQVGMKLADGGISVVVTVGALAAHIAVAAAERGVQAAACQDHAAAQAKLREWLRAGDTVLIKGSRGMKMENMLRMFEVCS